MAFYFGISPAFVAKIPWMHSRKLVTKQAFLLLDEWLVKKWVVVFWGVFLFLQVRGGIAFPSKGPYWLLAPYAPRCSLE